MTIPFQIDGDRPIDGLLDLPAGDGPFPTVVVCHGFKGFMEWGFFPSLADLLTSRRLAVVRFNFTGGGVRPGEDAVSDFEAFRNNTIGQELDDLGRVLDHLGDLDPAIDPNCIGLLGHSRGGAMALLTAARTAPTGLRALVTWSAIATFDRLPPEQVEAWRASGEITVLNTRTGQELPLGIVQLEEYERHREAYDLETAAGAVRVPWLVVHGEADPTVPVAEGRRLAKLAGAEPAYVEIPETDHVFGAQHPFRGPNPALIEAFNATQSWLVRWLRS